MSILHAHSHQLTQPILLAGRPSINLTIYDYLLQYKIQFTFCQFGIQAEFA